MNKQQTINKKNSGVNNNNDILNLFTNAINVNAINNLNDEQLKQVSEILKKIK